MVSPRPIIFDRARQRAYRARAAALGPSTFLIERVAEDLSDRLAAVLRRFDCALDLGPPTPAVRPVLAASGKVGTIIAPEAAAGRGGGGGQRGVVASRPRRGAIRRAACRCGRRGGSAVPRRFA